MTPAEALEASIAHWKQNMEAPEKASISSTACSLCRLFANSCLGCPVMVRTGHAYCSRTPYRAAWDAWRDWRDNPTHENRAAFIAAATAMHDWLVKETTA